MKVQIYSIQIFDFENEGQDVDDLDENWHANVPC